MTKPELHTVHSEPRTNTRGEQLWTMVELRGEIDRFADMLRAEDKRHGTIASYVTQAERFLNWLEGTYRPRTPRLGRPYGWYVNENSRTKYRPLLDHLANHPANAVTMTFRDIERVLGVPLPLSAKKYRHWWANDKTGTHSQAYAWLAAGRKVVRVDLLDRTVMFIDAETNYRPSAGAEFG